MVYDYCHIWVFEEMWNRIISICIPNTCCNFTLNYTILKVYKAFTYWGDLSVCVYQWEHPRKKLFSHQRKCICCPGTRCGIGAVPQALVTLGETLNVTFSSNNRIVDTGFMAHYQVVDPSEVEGECGTPVWAIYLVIYLLRDSPQRTKINNAWI